MLWGGFVGTGVCFLMVFGSVDWC